MNDFCRDENEDLVDYGDSDMDSEATDYKQASNVDIDIFADETIQIETAITSKNLKRPIDMAVVEAAPITTSKTSEAASMIKTLNEHVIDPKFRAALGLVEPGASLGITFRANGFDFMFSFQLIGAAQIRSCKYSADYRNRNALLTMAAQTYVMFSPERRPRSCDA